MPIDFSRFRLQNLFPPFVQENSPDMISPEMFQQQTPPDEQDIPSNLIQQMYQPRTKLSGMFADELGKMPQREEPSKMRKFGAALASLGAHDPIQQQHTIDQFQYAPYYRKLGDWKTRIDTLMKGATEEDKYNMNQRLLAQAVGSFVNKGRQLDISKQRADAYEFDKMNPDWKPFAKPGGNLVYINPKDPTEIHDTGIESGKLSDEEKISLQSGKRLNEIAASGIERRKTVEKAGDVQKELIPIKGEEARKTKAAPSGATATPTQEKVKQYTNARRALLEHPEWSKFITLDTQGPNTFKVENPSTGHWFSSGPDEATHKKITEAIVGSSSSTTNDEGAPKAPLGWKYVKKPGGGWTAVEDKKE